MDQKASSECSILNILYFNTIRQSCNHVKLLIIILGFINIAELNLLSQIETKR